MKKSILFIFSISFCFNVFVKNDLSAQTISTTIQYNGAQALGCCTVCGSDYWCFNNVGGCGTSAPC